jgi:hypothetical protein
MLMVVIAIGNDTRQPSGRTRKEECHYFNDACRLHVTKTVNVELNIKEKCGRGLFKIESWSLNEGTEENV